MTAVGIFGIILGLLASLRTFIEPTRLRVTVFVTAYLVHLGTTLLYYQLVQNSPGDTALYYFDYAGYYHDGFSINTSFIIYIVQSCKMVFGGTYLDYFLLFQSFGFFGVAILMRTFEEIYADVGVEQPPYTYLLFFLPGLHYWTSAIGKDALFFFATSLSIWAMLRLRERFRALSFAIVILFLIRPHIAMITLAALAFTVLRDRRTTFWVRLLLFVASLGGVALAVVTMRATFQIDFANANVVGDMLAGRQALVQTEAAGRTAVDAIYPLRVLSLLFRPFFVDAGGGLGLIVSIENAVFLLMVLTMVYRWREVMNLVGSVPYVRFALATSIAITLLLAIGYYNVGLGIRQKATMILPGIMVAFISLRAILDARKGQASAVAVAVANRPDGVTGGQRAQPIVARPSAR